MEKEGEIRVKRGVRETFTVKSETEKNKKRLKRAKKG